MKKAVYRKLRTGTIIAIPLDDVHVAYGHVVEPGMEFYLCVYKPIFLVNAPVPQLGFSPIALIGRTTDELLCHERWQIAGQQEVVGEIPRPYHVVGTPNGLMLRTFNGVDVRTATEGDLDFYGYHHSVSNILFVRAMRDIHGIDPYNEDYTRIVYGYVRERS